MQSSRIARLSGAGKTTLTLITALLLVAALLAGTAGAQNPGGGTAPVREQNLDATGAIRVHETGVADVTVKSGSLEVSNFPVTQQVAGTVNVGNLPATQQVAGTVNVGNLPSTQNVNVVGGAVETATATVNAAFRSGLLQMDEISAQQVVLDPPVYATTISLRVPDKEEARYTFKGQIPGCGLCDVMVLSTPNESNELIMLPTPMRIDRIDVSCLKAGAFLDSCLPEIFVSGLKV